MFVIFRNNHPLSWSNQTDDLRFCAWNVPMTGYSTRAKAERAVRLSIDNGLGSFSEYKIQKAKERQ